MKNAVITLSYTEFNDDETEYLRDKIKHVEVTLLNDETDYLNAITPKMADFLRSIGFTYVNDVVALDEDKFVLGQIAPDLTVDDL